MSTGFAAAGPVTPPPPPAPSSALLRISDVSKTFPGTKALDDVAMDVAPGEIHALIGQNGSGKSTLIKVLAGYHHADPGAKAWINDEPVDLNSAVEHRHHRMRFVHQDLGLFLELGAADNLALRSEFSTDPAAPHQVAGPAGGDAGPARPVRPRSRPVAAAGRGDAGPADHRGDRRRPRRLGGRARPAGPRRADRGPAAARCGTAPGDHPDGPRARHQHPVRVASPGRGAAHRRPGHRAAWGAGGGDQARRGAGHPGAGRADGRLRCRRGLPGRAGGAARSLGRAACPGAAFPVPGRRRPGAA